ncbi:MAG TPA: tail fiber domain-containing protein [Chthoniobacterales bacterium]|jgi:hypothetical protein
MQAGCNNTPCAASDNTYFGMDAGNPGSGADNTAVGFDALFTNTSGIQNTAIGSQTLVANTEGYNNTAVGKTALQSNTTAIDGTAVGVAALQLNTTGNFNTGIGLSALTQNSTGTLNTAVGTSALYYSNGNSNTAIGANALGFVVGGGNNTAEGYKALYNTTGNNNIGLGSTAGVNLNTGDNNIDIGNPGTAGEANTIRIGVENTQTSAYVAGIYQQPVFGKAKAIRVDSTGKLGTVAGSSARFKEDIKPMNSVSDILLSLKPVTFRYKKALDPEKTPQFGLVAEQVEKVDRDLVEYDQQGKPDGVRYDAVNAMLLNEFIKEHHQVAEQGMIIDHLKSVGEDQQKEIKALTASLKEQAAQVQKVSDELTMERPAPRMVSSGQ